MKLPFVSIFIATTVYLVCVLLNNSLLPTVLATPPLLEQQPNAWSSDSNSTNSDDDLHLFRLSLPYCEEDRTGPGGYPDPLESGSYSYYLNFSLSFQPAIDNQKARFTATLTNVSRRNLVLVVNPHAFHASLEITPDNGDVLEAFDRRYRMMLLTSGWFEPTMELRADQSIVWDVPLESLMTLYGDSVTHASLRGSSVTCEMSMAVIPTQNNASFVGNNAVQLSPAIRIASTGE